MAHEVEADTAGAFAGVLAHRDAPAPDDIAIPVAHGRASAAPVHRFALGPFSAVARGGHASEAADPIAIVAGTLDDRAALAAALGTPHTRPDRLVALAYARWGADAFAKLRGAFTAVVYDGTRGELALARAPGGGAAPPLYLLRDGIRSRFSTELAPLAAGAALDTEHLLAWLRHGRWPWRERTAYADLESVAPGHAVVISAKGRTHVRPFWSYVPFIVPRGLDDHAARAELDGAIAAALARPALTAPSVYGNSVAATSIARHLGAPTRAWVPCERAEIWRDVAALAEHPLPVARLGRLAALQSTLHEDAVTDLGAAETMGATPQLLAAWVQSVTRLLDASPGPRALARVLRLARPVSRALEGDVLARSVRDVAAGVASRWARHVPHPATSAALERLGGPSPAADDRVERVTGDPFVDQRFAATLDRSLEAEHAASVAIAARCGFRLQAPFLDAQVIELIFSLPPQLYLHDGRAMALVEDGMTIAEAARIEQTRCPAELEWIRLAEECVGVPAPASGELRDRYIGLGCFLAAR